MKELRFTLILAAVCIAVPFLALTALALTRILWLVFL